MRRVAWVVLAGVVLVALAAPWLTADPLAVRFEGRVAPLAPPSAAHWLGTDDVGRDVLARLVHGARTSLVLAALATAMAVGAGVLLGALAAGRPRARAALGGACDVVGALPPLVVVIAAQGLLGRAGVVSLAALVALPRAADVARLMAAELSRALVLPHAEAARALGAGRWRVVMRHALPLAAPHLAVAAAATVSTAVLAEAALGFLGLGVPPPTPSWGELILQAHRNALAWWLALPAGAVITGTVFSCEVLTRNH